MKEMWRNQWLLWMVVALLATSCRSVKPLSPAQKYSAPTLQKEFDLFRAILEDAHPGLYWYQPKEVMDQRFDYARSLIHDSLNETGYRNVLSYALSGIGCGHTTVRPSLAYLKANRVSSRFFPLVLKLWPDSALVVANLNRRDSLLQTGALVHAIDGRPIQQIVDTLFQHLSTDGYNNTHKYQTLSNRGGFGNLYTSLFGSKTRYQVSFTDTTGQQRTTTLFTYQPVRDTTVRTRTPVPAVPSRRERHKRELEGSRSFRIDTAQELAVMDVGTFTHGYRLRRFFRQSFRQLHKQDIAHLAIDLRGNGGGFINYSNLLTRYLVNKPYKVADSLYAIRRFSKYAKYRKGRLSNAMFMLAFARKRKDGLYHFPFYERKHFHPKKKHHFNGSVYLLTGGNTFSAATLMASALKPQLNVTVVGEETGGAAYGNNAWLIPDVTLPYTKVRFRLPLFRLVIDQDTPKNGRGIMPEVEAMPNSWLMRRGIDFKMERVRELVKAQGRVTAE